MLEILEPILVVIGECLQGLAGCFSSGDFGGGGGGDLAGLGGGLGGGGDMVGGSGISLGAGGSDMVGGSGISLGAGGSDMVGGSGISLGAGGSDLGGCNGSADAGSSVGSDLGGGSSADGGNGGGALSRGFSPDSSLPTHSGPSSPTILSHSVASLQTPVEDDQDTRLAWSRGGILPALPSDAHGVQIPLYLLRNRSLG